MAARWTTLTISLMPSGMSGKGITPNWDPAMSKLLSSELECVAIHDTCLDFEPLLARSRTEQVEHDGDWSVAITSALRRPAGIPAPLPAATSRNRMPARSSAGVGLRSQATSAYEYWSYRSLTRFCSTAARVSSLLSSHG